MEAILKYRISRTFTLVAALTALYASRDAVAQQVDRTVLPIPEPQPPVVTELSARDVSPPARFDVKAPQGAPNVVVGGRRRGGASHRAARDAGDPRGGDPAANSRHPGMRGARAGALMLAGETSLTG